MTNENPTECCKCDWTRILMTFSSAPWISWILPYLWYYHRHGSWMEPPE